MGGIEFRVPGLKYLRLKALFPLLMEYPGNAGMAQRITGRLFWPCTTSSTDLATPWSSATLSIVLLFGETFII